MSIYKMAIISTEEAAQQLNELDDENIQQIKTLIPASLGLIEGMLGRDIVEVRSELTEFSTDPIVFSELSENKQAALLVAIKLVLSSLYVNREAEVDKAQVVNPALTAALSSFKRVRIG